MRINVSQANIAILSGTIIMPEENDNYLTGTIDIAYPEGFTKDNCTVISVISHNTTHTDWWSTPSSAAFSNTALLGNGDTTVILKPDNITVMSSKVDCLMPRKDVTFKIMLMKTE